MCPVCIGELTVLYFFLYFGASAIQFIVICTCHHGVTFEFNL
ncbi:zinc finger (ubiquitin-hydrolase) domain-containing protein [Zea mays]|nr:zinc finger (ubiquitin-hydrolase) domain-containing protein [Zea mays]ONM12968.1 zinc finger (ubiquitin-hydrolase) domain-containing protein [Zea mays]